MPRHSHRYAFAVVCALTLARPLHAQRESWLEPLDSATQARVVALAKWLAKRCN